MVCTHVCYACSTGCQSSLPPPPPHPLTHSLTCQSGGHMHAYMYVCMCMYVYGCIAPPPTSPSHSLTCQSGGHTREESQTLMGVPSGAHPVLEHHLALHELGRVAGRGYRFTPRLKGERNRRSINHRWCCCCCCCCCWCC